MYFIKVRPDRDLRLMQARMQKIMDEMMNLSRPVLSSPDSGWLPEGDIYEVEDGVVLLVNLAGVRKEDIEVSFNENHLLVRGARYHDLPKNEPVRFHKVEMGQGPFERLFRIPAPVDPEGIEASYADGLLTIRLKRKREPRNIQVNINT